MALSMEDRHQLAVRLFYLPTLHSGVVCFSRACCGRTNGYVANHLNRDWVGGNCVDEHQGFAVRRDGCTWPIQRTGQTVLSDPMAIDGTALHRSGGILPGIVDWRTQLSKACNARPATLGVWVAAARYDHQSYRYLRGTLPACAQAGTIPPTGCHFGDSDRSADLFLRQVLGSQRRGGRSFCPRRYLWSAIRDIYLCNEKT